MKHYTLKIISAPLFTGEVNCYILETTHFLIIIDTAIASAEKQVVCALSNRIHTGKKLLILNTHGHWDHAALNGYLKTHYNGIILAHPNASVQVKKDEQFQSIYGNFFAHNPGAEKFHTFFDAEFRYPAPPDICLVGGEVIQDDGFALHVFYTPGHSDDSLTFYEEHSGFLFSGDALQGGGFIGNAPFYQNASAYRNSIEKLRSLHPQKILCGHTKQMDIRSSVSFLEKSLSSYKEIDDAVCHFLTSGDTSNDILASFPFHLASQLGYNYSMHIESTVDAHLQMHKKA